MPGRKARLTSIANPLGEIDEGHQARDCTHMVIFTSFRVERVAHTCPANLLSSLLPPADLARVLAPCATGIGPNKALRAAATMTWTASRSSTTSSSPACAPVLRRTSGPRHARLTVRDLEIELAARIVTVAGEHVQLSAREYELLVALAEDPHPRLAREPLRRKLNASAGTAFVLNVWGVGYRLVETGR